MHTLHPINRRKLHEKLSVPSLITVHSVPLISPGQAVKFHLTFSDIKLKVMLSRSACWRNPSSTQPAQKQARVDKGLVRNVVALGMDKGEVTEISVCITEFIAKVHELMKNLKPNKKKIHSIQKWIQFLAFQVGLHAVWPLALKCSNCGWLNVPRQMSV